MPQDTFREEADTMAADTMAITAHCQPIEASECPPAKRTRTGSASAHTTAAAGKGGIADHRGGALCKSIGDGQGVSPSAGDSVDCAQAAPRRRCAPAAAHAPIGFGFLPLGMMARMIHNQGADGLGIASDAESSDEEEDNDTDMGE